MDIHTLRKAANREEIESLTNRFHTVNFLQC